MITIENLVHLEKALKIIVHSQKQSCLLANTSGNSVMFKNICGFITRKGINNDTLETLNRVAIKEDFSQNDLLESIDLSIEKSKEYITKVTRVKVCIPQKKLDEIWRKLSDEKLAAFEHERVSREKWWAENYINKETATGKIWCKGGIIYCYLYKKHITEDFIKQYIQETI